MSVCVYQLSYLSAMRNARADFKVSVSRRIAQNNIRVLDLNFVKVSHFWYQFTKKNKKVFSNFIICDRYNHYLNHLNFGN